MAANPDWDELLTTTLIHHRGEMSDNFFETNTWWFKIRDRRRMIRGESIKEELRYAGNPHGGYYSKFDTLSTQSFTNLDSIQNGWTQHSAPVAISGFEEAVNQGTERVISILENKLETTELSVQDTWNYDSLNGNGVNPKALHGLELIINTNPYGGIDPAGASGGFWQPSVWDGSAGPFTFNVMVEDITTIRDTKNQLDLVLTSKDLYMGLLKEANALGIGLEQSRSEARLGFESVRYMGVEVAYDNDLADGTVYYITTDKLTLWACGDRFMKFTSFMQPHNQDARIAHMLSQIQLTGRERRAFGKRWNQTPSVA